MKETGPKKNYLSYLLRMWQDGDSKGTDSPEGAFWRASLQDPLSGNRLVFISLEELFSYLRRVTRINPQATGETEDE